MALNAIVFMTLNAIVFMTYTEVKRQGLDVRPEGWASGPCFIQIYSILFEHIGMDDWIPGRPLPRPPCAQAPDHYAELTANSD